MARDLESLGRTGEARALIDRALSDPSDRSARALALLERATLLYDQREYQEARQYAAGAQRILEVSQVPVEEFAALLLEARIDDAVSARQSAEHFLDRALALAEQIRMQTANPELRAGLWQPIRPAFDMKIRLVTAGTQSESRSTPSADAALASLKVAERSRSRSLADYQRLHESSFVRAGDRGHRLSTMYREIADRRVELEARRDRSAANDPRVRAILADIADLRRQIDTVTGSTTTKSPRAEAPAIASAVESSVETIPADIAVIEYWLGEDTAWAWTASNGAVKMVNLGSSKTVERSAREFQASLSNVSTVPQERRERLAVDLYNKVIAPLPPDVLRAPFLIVVPDGALHYVPFAALARETDGRARYLIEDHAIATAASVASLVTRLTPREFPDHRRVLIVSDPIYSSSDDRVGSGQYVESDKVHAITSPLVLRAASLNHTLERLPATTREADAVAALFDRSEVDSLSGFDASRDAFLERDLADYRIIHIATHAVNDAESPQLSALLLSVLDRQGNAVSSEVFAGELTIRRINADVLVLSACDTALGYEMAGEGLLGLRYAALASGARSVVASLWEVPDRPAADLMTAFYEYLVRDREAPAVALANAMRDTKRRFADPALWGPFQISITGHDALTRDKH
jgi:CHAT domain-containing protein